MNIIHLEQRMERRGETSLYSWLRVGTFDTVKDAEEAARLVQEQMRWIKEGQGLEHEPSCPSPVFKITVYLGEQGE